MLFVEMLNDYCLRNGGTIPVVHTFAIWHPNTAKMSWKSTLRSFISRSLSQDIEKVGSTKFGHDKKTTGGSCGFTKICTDLITAESSQVCSTFAPAQTQ